MSQIEPISVKGDVFYGVQYLRFIAATLVIIVHSMAQIIHVGRGNSFISFGLGASGVDIFFVISGFLMCLITEKREKSAKEFLLHRFLRVAPPYWVVTFFMAAVVLIAPQVFRSAQLTPDHFLSSLFFIAWPHPVLGTALPLYNPGWTLNNELFFYVLFSAFLFLPLGKKIISVSLCLIALALAGILYPSQNLIYNFYTFPIMLEFVFGMMIAYWVIRKPIPSVFTSYGLLCLGVVLLVGGGFLYPVEHWAPMRVVVWGIPAALIMAGVVFLEKSGRVKPIKTLQILGDASYAAYITHLFALGAVGLIWKKLGLSNIMPDVFLLMTCLIAAWVGGVLFHFIVEKNLLRLLKGKLMPSRASSSTQEKKI